MGGGIEGGILESMSHNPVFSLLTKGVLARQAGGLTGRAAEWARPARNLYLEVWGSYNQTTIVIMAQI